MYWRRDSVITVQIEICKSSLAFLSNIFVISLTSAVSSVTRHSNYKDKMKNVTVKWTEEICPYSVTQVEHEL